MILDTLWQNLDNILPPYVIALLSIITTLVVLITSAQRKRVDVLVIPLAFYSFMYLWLLLVSPSPEHRSVIGRFAAFLMLVVILFRSLIRMKLKL